MALVNVLDGPEFDWERLRAGDRTVVIQMMRWALHSLASHKEKVTRARRSIPVAVLAQHTQPTRRSPPPPLVRQPSRSHDDDFDGGLEVRSAASKSVDVFDQRGPGTPVSGAPKKNRPWSSVAVKDHNMPRRRRVADDERMFEQVIEIGVPEAWNPNKLVELMKMDSHGDGKRGGVRWKWLLPRRKEAGVPPKGCLHPEQAGALNPQLLCTYPRALPGELSSSEMGTFCFPQGIRLSVVDANRSDPRQLKQEWEESFVFQVSSWNQKKSQRQLYGVCLVDRRRCRLKTGELFVEIPRCFCILTHLPLIDLHRRVLKAVVGLAKQQASQRSLEGVEAAVFVRDAVRKALVDYGALRPPEPGGRRLRWRVPIETATNRPQEILYERPDATRYAKFLESVLRRGGGVSSGDDGESLMARMIPKNMAGSRVSFEETFVGPSFVDRIPKSMSWTRADYANIDATAEWSVPLALNSVPAPQLLRTLAAVLCELQVVIISSDCSKGAACCLALAAFARPMLWVSSLIPVLPIQLQSVFDAPTPFIAATPRTKQLSECVAKSYPYAGAVILDVDTGHLCFHPNMVNFLELPNSEVLLEALQPLLAVIRDPQAKITRVQEASRVAQRYVARHVARLCRITACFDGGLKDLKKKLGMSPSEMKQSKDSVEFAKILRQQSQGIDDNTNAEVAHGRKNKKVPQVDAVVRGSFDYLFHSEDEVRHISKLPLVDRKRTRHEFFEKLITTQMYCVFKETFPGFEPLAPSEREELAIPTPELGPASRRNPIHATSVDRGGNTPPPPAPKLHGDDAVRDLKTMSNFGDDDDDFDDDDDL